MMPSGLLPLGRHPATESEIEAMFVADAVFAASTTRADIWRDFQRARATLAHTIPLLAAWIGGSFSTAKLAPDDIDVVWIVDGRAYPTLDRQSAQILSVFGQGKVLRTMTGLAVDSYVITWLPIPAPDVENNPTHGSQAAWRGYWDDFWLRKPQSAKSLPPTAADSVPRRGYLEVTYRADYLQP
jgi:hypothetical protein